MRFLYTIRCHARTPCGVDLGRSVDERAHTGARTYIALLDR